MLWLSILQDILDNLVISVCSKNGIKLLFRGSLLQSLNALSGMENVEG